MVTGASGIPAFDGSVTRPEMVAVEPCPYKLALAASKKMQGSRAIERALYSRSLLITFEFSFPLLGEVPPRCVATLSLTETGV